ncbi:hypothetical protein [Caballeronia telluris]|uniref:Uncharacterized protein n=1 Tax=Caballeronia telluris TaxID=326475 RepID=A0A158ESV6_9BURK|nr:hypothetical protein [Caballeronia telluris]SAL10654.1 hypothetical protein AWB66_00217 [Caballeronia telluris]
MNTRERMRSATQVALIRSLQLDRQRLEAQRVAAEALRAHVAEIDARALLHAQTVALRRALQADSAIAPNLIADSIASINAARARADAALNDAKRTAEHDERERVAHAHSQRLVELADETVSRTTRTYTRTLEQRQSDAIEETLRARGVRP